MTLSVKIIHYSGLVFCALLLPLILSILVSWNAIPGNLFYPIKRGLEDIALVVVDFDFSTESYLRDKFIGRRFQEMQQLLDKGSTQGAEEFLAEVEAEKVSIFDEKIHDQQAAKKQAQKLKLQLNEYDQILNQKKQSLAAQQNISPEYYPPASPPSQFNIEPGIQTTQIITSINKVQQQIQITISELD